MKANELRIGNYVYDTLGKVNTVCVETFIKFNHQIKPIPLNEEWLLKFGFEKKSNTDANIYILEYGTGQYLNIIETKKFWFPTLIDKNQNKVFSLYGKEYVHQLQNLVYALIGEELTIKE